MPYQCRNAEIIGSFLENDFWIQPPPHTPILATLYIQFLIKISIYFCIILGLAWDKTISGPITAARTGKGPITEARTGYGSLEKLKFRVHFLWKGGGQKSFSRKFPGYFLTFVYLAYSCSRVVKKTHRKMFTNPLPRP